MYEPLREPALDVILTDDLQLRFIQDLHGPTNHRWNRRRQEAEGLDDFLRRCLSLTVLSAQPQVTFRDFLLTMDLQSLIPIYVVYRSIQLHPHSSPRPKSTHRYYS